ncbi:unnamed protein product [Mytilus edulis]|uniref:Uncharacterized protein n=1 Tax=Mytilus edulis TaxID=6550 RepID=A0A8S3UIS0_MYTED|nr:unnamed protein product [Mytilus edulis]
MKAPEGTDILNMTLKTEINEIVATLYNVTITYENMNYSYKQLCARRNNTCFASHAFLYSDYFWLQVERHNISYPEFRMDDGNIIELNHIFGGVHTNNDGLIISVQALKMMFYLRQDSNQYSSLASKWEEEFINIGRRVVYHLTLVNNTTEVEGENRNVRVFEAIVRSGGPIFNGAMSTLVDYAVGHFVGLGHAIFLLPVVLSLFGPHKKSEVEKKVIFNQEKMSQDVNEYFPNKMAHDNKGYCIERYHARVVKKMIQWLGQLNKL